MNQARIVLDFAHAALGDVGRATGGTKMEWSTKRAEPAFGSFRVRRPPKLWASARTCESSSRMNRAHGVRVQGRRLWDAMLHKFGQAQNPNTYRGNTRPGPDSKAPQAGFRRS